MEIEEVGEEEIEEVEGEDEELEEEREEEVEEVVGDDEDEEEEDKLVVPLEHAQSGQLQR